MAAADLSPSASAAPYSGDLGVPSSRPPFNRSHWRAVERAVKAIGVVEPATLLHGPLGVGRAAVLDEIADSAPARVEILRWRSGPLDVAAILTTLAPALGLDAARLGGETREATAAAMAALSERKREDRAVVLLADVVAGASVDAFRLLLRLGRSGGFVAVLAGRSALADALRRSGDPALGEIVERSVALKDFAPAEVRELLRDCAPTLGLAGAERLTASTGGCPEILAVALDGLAEQADRLAGDPMGALAAVASAKGLDALRRQARGGAPAQEAYVQDPSAQEASAQEFAERDVSEPASLAHEISAQEPPRPAAVALGDPSGSSALDALDVAIAKLDEAAADLAADAPTRSAGWTSADDAADDDGLWRDDGRSAGFARFSGRFADRLPARTASFVFGGVALLAVASVAPMLIAPAPTARPQQEAALDAAAIPAIVTQAEAEAVAAAAPSGRAAAAREGLAAFDALFAAVEEPASDRAAPPASRPVAPAPEFVAAAKPEEPAAPARTAPLPRATPKAASETEPTPATAAPGRASAPASLILEGAPAVADIRRFGAPEPDPEHDPLPAGDWSLRPAGAPAEPRPPVREAAETAFGAAESGARALSKVDAIPSVVTEALDEVAALARERRVTLSRARRLEALDPSEIERLAAAAAERADRLIDAERYTEPAGANAYHVLLEALEIAPQDPRLLGRLERLTQIYDAAARAALAQERFGEFYRYMNLIDRIRARRPV